MLLHDLITKIGSPFILRYEDTSLNMSRRFKLLGITPFVISLIAAKDKLALFERLRIAMRMPYSEITNWDALDEALGDLSWLPHTSINIVLEGAETFYRHDQQSFRTFLDIVENAGATWAVPVAEGEWWDRGAVPFHLYVDAKTSEHFPFKFPDAGG
ncbi:barstar family protein [Agrobacterium sp. Ap1]|uniref:barstar family protein n=1 Tax=Agrobacterium sp. Ap1 TaxID=2815337 RepID=UPI001A8D3F25|nr:barstar family protein [Agrobacterium sp. Ap1]MBO0145472.1 barstar family protein [Agrobacterium sp. Ap1]